MKKLDLVILAGGKGTRIKKYLKKKPKPLAIFNKKPFLQYLINNLVTFQSEWQIKALEQCNNKIKIMKQLKLI